VTGTKLYCLVTEAHACKQLAQGRYLTAARPAVELATSPVASQRLTPLGHTVHCHWEWARGKEERKKERRNHSGKI